MIDYPKPEEPSGLDQLEFTNVSKFGGWVAPHMRTIQQEEQSKAFLGSLPAFKLDGTFTGPVPQKVLLTDVWSHKKTKESLKFDFGGFWQVTGSCVGASAGNTQFTLAATEVIRMGDPEKIMVPFWPLTYGLGRMLGGMNGRGEGSFGGPQAEAYRKYGTLAWIHDGLPRYTNRDGMLQISSRDEFAWSNGREAPERLINLSKNHPVETMAYCKNADDVKMCIITGKPVTTASMWGGMDRCPVVGRKDPVLLSRRVTSWAHQMSILGWWDHSEIGEIFFIMNQWGPNFHGRCPSGAPGGGFWVKKEEVEWMCRTSREVIGYSQFKGFPADNFEWIF